MKLTYLIFFIIAFLLTNSYNSESQDITDASSFMKIGAGARAISLGGAYVATADDASAGYWNPAGLAQITRPVVLLADRIPEMDTNYAGVAIASPAWGFGFVGVNGIYYDCGEVITYDQNGKNTGVLTDQEAALILSYAYGLNKFSFGINGKYFYQQMEDDQSSVGSDGIGADFGILYGIDEKLRLGATFHSQYNMISSNDDTISGSLPIKVQAGICYKTGENKEYLNLMLGFEQTRFNPLKLHLGAELVLYDILALRTGLNDIYVENQSSNSAVNSGIEKKIDHLDLVKENLKPTFGIGFKWKMGSGLRVKNALIFDYALSLEKLGAKNFFTLAYQF
jgi:hypothetical protein